MFALSAIRLVDGLLELIWVVLVGTFQQMKKGKNAQRHNDYVDLNECTIRAYCLPYSSSSAVYRVAGDRCSSLITLGTPHIAPDTALVDQTRGLIREIDETPSCSAQALADRGIAITCVCSSSLRGAFLSTNVEELVAASSYLPLLGRIGSDVQGDGIVPLDLAFMDPPARKVVVDKCEVTGSMVRHSHVVPTPWNLWDGYAPSIVLPDTFSSYVSEGVIPQWAKYIS